jgi:hypothetical protein
VLDEQQVSRAGEMPREPEQRPRQQHHGREPETPRRAPAGRVATGHGGEVSFAIAAAQVHP